MATGLPGGTSFMEDYTYDFAGVPRVLGSHMLKICPTIAADKPALQIHPLGSAAKQIRAAGVYVAGGTGGGGEHRGYGQPFSHDRE